MTRPRLELAEVIRSCRDAFLGAVRCEPGARAARALDAPTACRTAAPGGCVLRATGVRAHRRPCGSKILQKTHPMRSRAGRIVPEDLDLA